MARIRSIKPEFFTDPEVVACTPLARLLFIGSWNLADDYGVLKDDPERLRLQLLPGDDVDAYALVDELVGHGLLRRTVDPDGAHLVIGEPFLRWSRSHLRIQYAERRRMTPNVRRGVLEACGRWCFVCGWPHTPEGATDGKGLEIDHVVPVSAGGKTEAANLTVLCRGCNQLKGADDWDTFIARRNALLAGG